MRRDIERQMLTALPCGTLKAGDDAWRLYVLETRRVDRDWFVHLVALGRREHTIDVRVRADRGHSETAQRVLGAIRDFLIDGDDCEQVYLELPGISELAS